MNCYRHSDREAFIRCQRCENYICPECQHEAAVGFLCSDCAGVTRTQQLLNKSPKSVRRLASKDNLLTFAIMAICAVIWLGQVLIPSSLVTLWLAYAPALTFDEPWRMITTGFLHSTNSPLHLGLNMYTLYVFGRELEPLLGRLRFAVLYLLALISGSVMVLWLNDPFGITIGASGAIFGLMGAYLVVNRSLGYGSNQITSLIAINLVFSFLLPGVSWQAHVGGLIGGLAVGYIYSITRRASQRNRQVVLVSVFGALLVLLTVAGATVKLAGLY